MTQNPTQDVALIVGGGPGISSSCARLFAKNGMRVAIAARQPDKPVLQSLEKTHGITLRLIGWPDTVRPGVGVDPQNVINQQVRDQYDIYVGVWGSRFGQSTPRAGSGTEEEFRQALV